MWSPELILGSWERADRFEADALRQHHNVAEWCNSSHERDEAFDALVLAARQDLSTWEAVPLGVIPCGVGSLVVAVRMRGVDAVAKWMPEPRGAAHAAALAAAFNEAKLGPPLIASSTYGLVLERVIPGVPLRSLRHDEDTVVAVAALLPTVRRIDPQVLDPLTRVDPIADMTEAQYDDLATEADGFSARAIEYANAACDAVAGLERYVGHRDMQLGNVLCGVSGKLSLVDAGGSFDAGYDDAGRLVAHATADAWGSGKAWDARQLIARVAAAAELDAEVLAVVVRAKAASTARYIRRCVPERAWEWQASDRLCETL